MTKPASTRFRDLGADRRPFIDNAVRATRRGLEHAERACGRGEVNLAAENLRRGGPGARRAFRNGLRRAVAGVAALALLDPAGEFSTSVCSYVRLNERVAHLLRVEHAVDAGPERAPSTFGGRKVAL